MDPLIALLALLLVAAALVGSGYLACRGMTDLFAGLFHGPELGWPHGVQEEDPVPWNWAAGGPGAAAERVDTAARTSPLAPHVRRGLARKGHW